MLGMGCFLSVIAWGWGGKGSEVLLLLKLQDIAIALGHSPWLHDKTLLLKILHALVEAQRETKLELSSRYPPCWVAFINPENAMQASGREKPSAILPSSGPFEL